MIKRYELIIEYNSESDEIEVINEEIIEEQVSLQFFGNLDAVDVMDMDSIRKINSFFIGEC